MKNLLITTLGEYNHYGQWSAETGNYDLYPIDYTVTPTFKYPGIYLVLKEKPSLLEHDYFWMPDEDISLSVDGISAMFDCMREYDLTLAQPSVERSELSFPSWECFVHKDGQNLIYTSFVEIMCPCFSRRGLDICLDTFNKSKSGWGLDLVWAKKMKDYGENVAILNNIVVRHTRPIGGGGLYNALKKANVNASRERLKLMAEYGIKEVKEIIE